LRICEEPAVCMYGETMLVLTISVYEQIVLWYYTFAQIWGPRYQKL